MNQLQKIIREKELPQYVGLKRSQVNKLIKLKQFPAPFKISDVGRAIAWFESDLVAWQQERLAKRDGVPAASAPPKKITTQENHHPRKSPPKKITTQENHHPRKSPPKKITTQEKRSPLIQP